MYNTLGGKGLSIIEKYIANWFFDIGQPLLLQTVANNVIDQYLPTEEP